MIQYSKRISVLFLLLWSISLQSQEVLTLTKDALEIYEMKNWANWGICATSKSNEIYVGGPNEISVYSLEKREMVRTIKTPIGQGVRPVYESERYLVLINVGQVHANLGDFTPNMAVFDKLTEEIIYENKGFSLAFNLEQKTFYFLSDSKLELRYLSDSKLIKKIDAPEGAKSIAFDSENKRLFISSDVRKGDENEVPSLGGSKKNLKLAMKKRQVVRYYDPLTLEEKGTIPEIYDQVSEMRYQNDELVVVHFPHQKVAATSQGYLNIVDCKKLIPQRRGFILYSSVYDFKVSDSQKEIIIVSFDHESKKVKNTPFEINMYNINSGELIHSIVFKDELKFHLNRFNGTIWDPKSRNLYMSFNKKIYRISIPEINQ